VCSISTVRMAVGGSGGGAVSSLLPLLLPLLDLNRCRLCKRNLRAVGLNLHHTTDSLGDKLGLRLPVTHAQRHENHRGTGYERGQHLPEAVVRRGVVRRGVRG